MDILMVAAELAPYARVTRAADVLAGLSKVVSQLGHEVTVALPRYRSFEGGGLLVARRLTPLAIGDDEQVTVFDGQLSTGVKIILFDAPELFDRQGQFGEDGEDYADNARRFGLLCRAATALVAGRAEQRRPFDIVHLHDWPAAPTALLLREQPDLVGGVVLTIYDAMSHGNFSPDAVESLHVPEALRDHIVIDGAANFLYSGLRCADAVTTASPTYARELEDGRHSGRLGAAFSEAPEELTGIVSGLDFAVFNPATDSTIVSRYDAEETANKGSSKTDLMRSLGLLAEPSAPLVVAVVDTDAEAELVGELMSGILKGGASLVVFGQAAANLAEAIESERRRFDSSCANGGALDDVQLRRACAGADFMLLPSTYDHDALRVRAAQRYGAVPIAVGAGAVEDAVVDCDVRLETGTGFLADEPSASALRAALGRALSAFRSERWPALRRRVMRLDLGWDRPARRYLQVYKQAQKSRAARLSVSR